MPPNLPHIIPNISSTNQASSTTIIIEDMEEMEGKAMNIFYSHKERKKRKFIEVSSSSKAATKPNSSKAQGTPATFGIPEVSSPL